jgi:hypothetical protein
MATARPYRVTVRLHRVKAHALQFPDQLKATRLVVHRHIQDCIFLVRKDAPMFDSATRPPRQNAVKGCVVFFKCFDVVA